METIQARGPSCPSGLSLKCELRGHEQPITQIIWSPDGRFVTSASKDCTIRIWNLADGTLSRVLLGHSRTVFCMSYSPDGANLASGSADTTIRLWDIQSGQVIRDFHGPAGVMSVAWSPLGQHVCSADTKTVRIWDIKTGRLENILLDHHKWVRKVLWLPNENPNEKMILSAGDDAALIRWSSSLDKPLSRITNHADAILDLALCMTKVPNIIASASADMTIIIWDGSAFRQNDILHGHTAKVTGVSFSEDGNLLASMAADGAIYIWSTTACGFWKTVAILSGSPTPFACVAFNPKKPVIATVGDDNTVIRIWDYDYEALISAVPSTTSVYYTNAKVVLVGNTGTGKTCLANALRGEPFRPEESTHGMKVWNFRSETEQVVGCQTTRETFLWDLAGQTDYQLVHQLFLDETALGIILFDPTDPENPFSGVEQWEKALRRVAGDDCARLLVAGRVDRGYPVASKNVIDEFRLKHGFHEFIATSAKTREGIERLCDAIRQTIPWFKLPITSSPELWKDIREYLLKRRASHDVLTRRSDLRSAFREKHPLSKFTEVEFDTVIGHAQAQGLLWRLSFGNFVLLKPELLNDYASAVIHVVRKHPDGLGCVKEREILEAKIDFKGMMRLPDVETERSLLHAVVELFLNREVALREGEHLVFPSKFNRERPEYSKPPLREVAYTFTGPVEDIYATLVVRVFYSGAFELKDLWKNVADFHDSVGNVCSFLLGSLGNGRGIISVFFDKAVSIDNKVLFLRFIHAHLQKRALAGSVVRERIYRCPACGEEVENKRAVEIRLQKGNKKIPCQYCDEQIMLIDLLEEKFGDPELLHRVRELEEAVQEKREQEVGVTTAKAKQDIGEFDVFLAHNNADKPLVEAIADELKRRGLNPWLDKWNVPPGRRFAEEIERVLPHTKSVAVVVGESGTGPWEDMEIYAALNLFAKNKRPLIPVLLPTAKQEPQLPLFLQQFSWVRFVTGTDDVEVLDNLEWGITGERPMRDMI